MSQVPADLRALAESRLEQYRSTQPFSPVRQVVLRCLAATWFECSSIDRIAALSGPLTGQVVSSTLVDVELQTMIKAGLVIRHQGHYSINLKDR